MASTYSTNLAIELIGTGDQAGSWGNTTNTNLGTLIEQAISGYVTQAVSTGTDTTITIPNGATGVARNMYIELTGTGGASTNLIVPANKKLYFIFNNSTGAVTVKVSGQTGVSVPTGKKVVLTSNGTDVVNGLNYIADFASNSATITNLSATSATITNLTLTSLVISNLSIASANITTLTSASATITNLLGTTLTISGNTFLATSSGNVGIGTTSPSDKLHVVGLARINTGTYAAGYGLTFQANAETSRTYQMGMVTGGNFAIYDSSAAEQRVVLDTSGNLGIGTASPSTYSVAPNLVVSTATNGGMTIRTGSSNYGAVFFADGTTGDEQYRGGIQYNHDYLGSTDTLLLVTAGTTKARLDSSGQLGLGVTPSVWQTGAKAVEIGGSGYLAFTGSTNGGYLYSNAYLAAGGNTYKATGFAAAYGLGPSGQHQWFTAPSGTINTAISFTQAMTLDASGNLGIGTTSPASQLDVTKTGDAVFSLTSSGVQRYQLIARSSGNFEIYDQSAAASRVTMTQAGNLGIGVTPSAWGAPFGSGVLEISGGYFAGSSSNNVIRLSSNNYYSGSNYIYKTSAEAAAYVQSSGQHIWYTAPSGTAGNAISFTQAMTLDYLGNLGLGTTSPAFRLDLKGSGQTCFTQTQDSTAVYKAIYGVDSGGGVEGAVAGALTNHPFIFRTNNTERARITAAGLFLVNIDTSSGYGGAHRIYRDVAEGDFILSVDGGGEYSALFADVAGANYSTNACAIRVGRNSSTLRSINAGGTVNASGADYAEYMTKAGDFAIAKGDVCGVNADGKLTNVFADAVSFVVKSTDPSYVGGDSWGSAEAIGLKMPDSDASEEEKNIFNAAIEAARQKVDRIAFAGQVPVNVLGATPGQYIVPVNDSGAIKGVAVSNPTFEQYQSAVGKVIAVQDDGRALIIVKVA